MSLTGWITLGNIITLSDISSSETYAYFYLPLEGEYQNLLPLEGEYQNLLEYEGYYDG